METTLDVFQAQQNSALDILARLEAFLRQGEHLGVRIDPTLLAKLAASRDQLAGDKLKIALVGGFSEGKTSIAAAWMERLDKSSMNISQQESSNEVKVYEVGDDFVLIDTPGLFGFKEQYNADTQTIEKYKDITRKYVSEAHLILYVMNSTNPIKESHADELNWLFRTLDLLPRTVFVLSRFDEVADVEDEQDYQENLKIKRDNVRSRLRDSIDATEAQLASLSIVAVAANPFDMGTEYWLANLDKFKALSHIASLQGATVEKIRTSGGPVAIVEQARNSVILDVLHKEVPVAVENDEKIGDEVNRLERMGKTLQEQLQAANSRISDVRISLRSFVLDYFTDLILQAKGLTLETCGEFFEREIGNEGFVMATTLQNEFDRQLNGVTQEISSMRLSFASEIEHFNSSVTKLGKQGVNYVVKSNLINNTSVIATRDGIVAVAKTLGMDLGKMLKFKPWGAVNLAKNINGALAVVGFALEAWDTYQQVQREEAFRESQKQMVDNFEKQRKEMIELLDTEHFIVRFFPAYQELMGTVQEMQDNIAQRQAQRQRFQAWRKTGETIEAEFVRLA
jgi:GTP-binding protein EngB required for normal cell division